MKQLTCKDRERIWKRMIKDNQLNKADWELAEAEEATEKQGQGG